MNYKQEQKELKQLAYNIVKKMIEMNKTHGCVAFDDFMGELTPIIPGRSHTHTCQLEGNDNSELLLFRQILDGLEWMDENTKPEVLNLVESYDKYLRKQDV